MTALEVLKGYEELEAMMVDSDGVWFDEMPDEIMEKFLFLQVNRNMVLYGTTIPSAREFMPNFQEIN